MPWNRKICLSAPTLIATVFCGNVAMAQVPATIAAPGKKPIATVHAEGAQIYECTAGTDGKLSWTFREPIASLFLNDKTLGRHYAGPTWESEDGSAVVGKAAGNAPGATENDIPWLKLDVVNHHGKGMFEEVDTVQRINTRGGAAQGTCDKAGAFRSVAYSADYVFLRKE